MLVPVLKVLASIGLNNKVSLQLFEFWEGTIWVSNAAVTIIRKAGLDKLSAQVLKSVSTVNLSQYYEPATLIC